MKYGEAYTWRKPNNEIRTKKVQIPCVHMEIMFRRVDNLDSEEGKLSYGG